MNRPAITLPKSLTALTALCALLLACSSALAQASSPNTLNVKVTPADFAAGAAAKTVYQRAVPANTEAGRAMRARQNAARLFGKMARGAHENGGIVSFPGDLSFLGGPVVDFTQSHAIFLLPNGSCPIAACWGDPEGFLRDLGRSDFIHIEDQYVGLFASDRYTVGFDANVTYTPPPVPLIDAQIRGVALLIASLTGDTGLGHVYQFFLPPGQDVCFDSTFTNCYSPDRPASFAFCAYHSSIELPDGTQVLYTVLPFANVAGCSVRPGTPNGQLVDSTDNFVSHETFETISDPDGSAWFNFSNLELFGSEIGDECEFVTFVGPNFTPFFDPPVFHIAGHKFAVQSEYSNDVHGCATAAAH